MDPADQVAIHEAMEQQTISIAKAGIHASLNARTSVLAAANPIGGRYDKTKSLRANLTITPAIMSRFDLMYIVLDKNDADIDESVARYIVSLHQKREQALAPPYSTSQLRRYIHHARDHKPVLSEAACRRLSEEYVNLRLSDQGRGKTAWRITVRQLESMIRLAEALARVHLDPEVRVPYVEGTQPQPCSLYSANTVPCSEASRLLRQSIVNIHMEEVEIALGRPEGTGGSDAELSLPPDLTLPLTVPPPVDPSLTDATKPVAPKKRTAKVSKAFFDSLTNNLVSHLKQREQINPTTAGTPPLLSNLSIFIIFFLVLNQILSDEATGLGRVVFGGGGGGIGDRCRPSPAPRPCQGRD